MLVGATAIAAGKGNKVRPRDDIDDKKLERIDEFVEILTDNAASLDAKLFAANGMGESYALPTTVKAESVLIKVLFNESNFQVRALAAKSLGSINDSSIVDQLIKAREGESEEEVINSLDRVLEQFGIDTESLPAPKGRPRTSDKVRVLQRDKIEFEKLRQIDTYLALLKLESPEAPDLVDQSESSVPERTDTVERPDSVDALDSTERAPTTDTSDSTAEALVSISNEKKFAIIRKLASEEMIPTTQEVVEMLKSIVNDEEDEYLKIGALKSLEDIGVKSVLPFLRTRLNTEQSDKVKIFIEQTIQSIETN